MHTPTTIYKLLLFLNGTLAMTTSAWALSLADLRGDSRVEIRSPQGLNELCVVIKKWPGAMYSSKDIEKEQQLCSYNFYSNMGVCPKYTSTNPAVLLLEPNAQHSKQDIDASDCNLKKMNVKTEAKFKQSVSCSYTPSILAYYTMSRILGDVGRVPTAVIRTMDRSTHQEVVRKANIFLARSPETIAKSWALFERIHRSPANYPSVVDSSGTQIYGGLSDNIKNEEYYSEVNGKGDYETRYERFIRQRPFTNVASARSATDLAGGSEFSKIAQTVTQMKDVADLVLIDTLMNQQDRIGNIHYKAYWYQVDGTKIKRSKSDAKWSDRGWVIPAEETEKMKGKQATIVKEMVLKDNDCGVIKTNMMRKIGALERVHHFSKETYGRFLAFASTIDLPSTRNFFMEELLFSSTDFATLRDNTIKARDVLTKKCKAGQLIFDVDLRDYIPGITTTPVNCEKVPSGSWQQQI